MIGKKHHNTIVAMQSAYIAGVTETPYKAMDWLFNHLVGLGMVPHPEDMTDWAQAYFEKNHK